jgi:hypothetical protein
MSTRAVDPRTVRGDQWSRGPWADRPGSAHGVPFVGMRGSLPRAPACAGALFQRLAAPVAVASRPAPARLVSRVAWSPFAPPFCSRCASRRDGIHVPSTLVYPRCRRESIASVEGGVQSFIAQQPRGEHVARRLAEQVNQSHFRISSSLKLIDL